MTKWLCFSGKIPCFRAKRLYSGKSGCNRVNLVALGQKWLYSGKSGYNRANVVVLGQKWLYSGKSGCIPERGCIQAKVVVFGQIVACGQSGCLSRKVVVIGQK